MGKLGSDLVKQRHHTHNTEKQHIIYNAHKRATESLSHCLKIGNQQQHRMSDISFPFTRHNLKGVRRGGGGEWLLQNSHIILINYFQLVGANGVVISLQERDVQ